MLVLRPPRASPDRTRRRVDPDLVARSPARAEDLVAVGRRRGDAASPPIAVTGRALPLALALALACGPGAQTAGDDASATASASSTETATATTTWTETEGTTTAAAPEIAFDRLVLHSEYYSEGAAIGDFDGDGHQDVAAGPYWYAGPDFVGRHTIYPAIPFDPKGYADNFHMWARDVDGDGRLDLVIAGFPGLEAAWRENPGPDGGEWPRHLIYAGVDGESPALVDLTGDGAPELVFAHGGGFGWAEAAADKGAPWTFHPLAPPSGLGPFTHGLGVGDLDGDGLGDLLEATGAWRHPGALAGDPPWTREAHDFGEGGAQMIATDVDGDGDADVVTSLAAHGYGLAWFERDGGDFLEHVFAPIDPADLEGPILHEPHALALADVNGDGLADVIAGERFWGHVPAGDPSLDDPAALFWFELRRDAEGARYLPHQIDDASGVGTQVAAGDVDGDGLVDVVIANKKGAFVFRQRPSG